MASAQHTAQATIDGTDLDPSKVRVELNDRWSPYGRADVTIPMPATVTLDKLDARTGARVAVAIGKDRPVQSRTFDLAVRDRVIDHNRKTVTLALATDEALLQDKRRVSPVADTSAYVDASTTTTSPAYSIATFIDSRILPELQADNLTRNPVPNNTYQPHSSLVGTFLASAADGQYLHARRLTSTLTTLSLVRADPDNVEPGVQYTYAFDVLPDATRALSVRLYDADTNGVIVTGSDVSCPGGVWTRLTITFTAPASGVVYPLLRWSTGAVDEAVRIRRLTLAEGAAPLAWSPPQLTTVTADYDFRDHADALEWTPGASAWDVIEPLLQTAGLRLYCDESRHWHLVAGDHTVPGLIQISEGENVTRARDTISRRSDAWYDSVVIAYTGSDPTVYDAAGQAGTRTLSLQYDRPFPGAGAAARILRRATGRGRVLELAAVSNYQAVPGMALVGNLPSTPAQTGYITGVEWRLPEDEMTIASRGLIDTPASAWAFLPAGEAWNDSPIGESWSDETV